MPKVSVIIANYNGEKFLTECIDSLVAQTYADFDIIVVDDNSTDRSVALLENTYEPLIRSQRLKLITSEMNRGFAYVNNLGAEYAQGEYMCLLNNDTILSPGALKEMTHILDTYADIGGTTGIILDRGHEKEMRESILVKKYKPVHSAIFSTVYVPQSAHDQHTIFVDGISGCCFMYRKHLAPLPFKDYYRAYGEDTYLSLVIRAQGYKLAMVPKPLIAHHGSASFGSKPSIRKVYHGVKNELINMYFFSSAMAFAAKLPALLFYHFLKLFIGGFGIRRKGSILGYKWFFSHKKFLRQEKKNLTAIRMVSSSLFSSRNILSPTYGPGEYMHPLKKLFMQCANAISRIYLTLAVYDKKN